MRVKIELKDGALLVKNRLSSHEVQVVDIEEINTKSLDRDPKSPPCLRIKVRGRAREIQLEATAASSQKVREQIADRFGALGLRQGSARRYVEW